MKKLISLIIAIALVVCLLPVMASAEVVTGIGLEATASGYVGDYVWLQPEYIGGDEWPADLVWTSSDPTIVEVSGSNWSCDCNLLAPGTATVTVTAGTLSASCEITAVAPKVLTLDAPLELDSRTFATFTPAEAGTYTIYAPEANCDVGGYIQTDTAYNEFDTTTDGLMRTATITLAAGEVCSIYTYAYTYTEEEINYKLVAVKTPALEGLALNTDTVELVYVSPSVYDTGYVYLNPTPITAAMPANLTWKMKDETVATVGYDFAGFCYFEALKAGETVLEVYDGETLIDSVQIVVKTAADVAQPLYWGVEYDIDTAETQVFMYTPSVTDTYTFQSFREKDEADPYVEILVKEQDEWITLDDFDDYDELDFYGEIQLKKDTEYMIVVTTLNERPGYAFSMKGTAASDPGYDLKKVAAKPASCAAEGNIEYYECQKTGILFANAEATKLAGDVTIAKVAHKLDKVAAVAATSEKEGNVAHEKCSVCGALVLEGKEVKAADVAIAKLDNASTGDTTMLVPVMALLVLSALGLGITAVARKKA